MEGWVRQFFARRASIEVGHRVRVCAHELKRLGIGLRGYQTEELQRIAKAIRRAQ